MGGKIVVLADSELFSNFASETSLTMLRAPSGVFPSYEGLDEFGFEVFHVRALGQMEIF